MQESYRIISKGIISSIGVNYDEVRQSLLQGKSGLSFPKYLHTEKKDYLLGEVKLSNEELAEELSLPLGLPRSYLLAAKALQACLAGINKPADWAKETGIFVGNTVGGIDVTERYYPSFDDEQKYKNHDLGGLTEFLASTFGVYGFVSTVNTACSSSLNAIIQAIHLMRLGKIKRAVVGGVDALSRFTLNGFDSLYILDKNMSRAFDASRKGLNLGEAAAFILIEPSTENETGICIKGVANHNDAFHQTASSDEGTGAYLAMRNAIEQSGLQIDDIDYINAHGTGTPNNDASEMQAMQRLFGEKIPPFSSTKSFTGHTLAAAGMVEIIHCCIALEEQCVFPQLNVFTDKLKVMPEYNIIKILINNVLSNSFGFGGNCSSVVLSKN